MVSPKAVLWGAAGVGGLITARSLADKRQVLQKHVALNARRRQDLSAPMYDPTAVKLSYDRFVKLKLEGPEKIAFLGGMANAVWDQAKAKAPGMAVDVAGKAFGNVLSKPVDWAAKKLEKTFVTKPEQHQALQHALKDPMVAQFHRENPGAFNDLHQALTKFAPNVSTNPLAVRTFMGYGASTGGALDFATLKLIADTEASHTGKNKVNQ